METKHCPRCGLTKPHSEFHRDRQNKDGLYGYCKDCNKAKAKAWTKANPEKARAQARRRNAEGRGRNSILMRKYGISNADYAEILAAQGGVCAICGRPEAGRDGHKNLAVDHCHTSNAIRGLLCHSCNRGIGLLQDSPEILERATGYLTKAPYQPSA